MPLINVCQNFDVCHNPVLPPEHLCEECKRAARQLEREIREDEKLERLNVVSKNSGLRRHSKPGWWKR